MASASTSHARFWPLWRPGRFLGCRWLPFRRPYGFRQSSSQASFSNLGPSFTPIRTFNTFATPRHALLRATKNIARHRANGLAQLDVCNRTWSAPPLLAHFRRGDGALTQRSECTPAVRPAIFAKTSARPGTRRTQPAGRVAAVHYLPPNTPTPTPAGVPAVPPPTWTTTAATAPWRTGTSTGDHAEAPDGSGPCAPPAW